MAKCDSVQEENINIFKGINGRIRRLAAEQNLSGAELSKAAGVSYRTVYAVMQGKARLQDRMVAMFAKALGTSVEWLLNGEGDPPKVVREQPGDYTKGSGKLRDAIQIIADQFGLPAEKVWEHFTELLRKSFNGGKDQSHESHP